MIIVQTLKSKSGVTAQGGISGFYTPTGLRTLAQGWRTRLPWVRQEGSPTPTGLRRMLDVMLKNRTSDATPLG
jgi:hypothetical protein